MAMTSVKCIDYTCVSSDVYCVRLFFRVYTRLLESQPPDGETPK